MKKITKRLSKLLLLFSLSTFVTPEANSHTYWGDDYDNFCDDAHSLKDNKGRIIHHDSEHKKKCFDIRKGTYRHETGAMADWVNCPKGKYCPGGSAGRVKPDKYSIAPDEGMSEPQACPTNQISDSNRLTCSYPQKLSEWDRLLDTKPKGSKYKDGKLVCKKGKNYSKQKGKCK